MKRKQPYSLQVIIASGPQDIGRAALGFAFALSAAASGVKVMVTLALEGVAWAKKNVAAAKQSVNGFEPIENYIDMLKNNGAVIQLCSSCAKSKCTDDKGERSTNDAASYVGLTEVAIRTANDAVQTVVF